MSVMQSDEESELEDMEKEVSGDNGKRWIRRIPFISPIILKAFLLTFIAEWGDKSQLVTIG